MIVVESLPRYVFITRGKYHEICITANAERCFIKNIDGPIYAIMIHAYCPRISVVFKAHCSFVKTIKEWIFVALITVTVNQGHGIIDCRSIRFLRTIIQVNGNTNDSKRATNLEGFVARSGRSLTRLQIQRIAFTWIRDC